MATCAVCNKQPPKTPYGDDVLQECAFCNEYVCPKRDCAKRTPEGGIQCTQCRDMEELEGDLPWWESGVRR